MDEARTPVVAAVAQAVERDAIVSSLDLAERAAREALGGSGALAKSVERVSVLSALFSPGATRPAGDLADRLGLPDGIRETTPGGGNYPQWLVTRAAEDIAAGRLRCTLIAGAESARSHRLQGTTGLFRAEPPTEAAGDTIVGRHSTRYFSPEEVEAGIRQPTTIYPLLESSRAAAAGRSFAEQRAFLGPLMARLTEIAARNPYAWFREPATAHEIVSPTDANRLICEPYTKRMNSFPYVDQAAALVVCSLEVARAAGLADQAVFVWSGADAAEVSPIAARAQLGRSLGMQAAVARALEAASVTADNLSVVDAYSCFPVALQTAADALGMALDDPRGLSRTGGMAYFGGPGNNYSTHGIAAIVEALRASGGLGACLAVGGFLTKQAVGIYGSEPPPRGFQRGDTAADQERIDASAQPLTASAEGPVTVVANTVGYDHTGRVPASAPLIAVDSEGRRLVAAAADEALPLTAGKLLVGTSVRVSGQPLRWQPAE